MTWGLGARAPRWLWRRLKRQLLEERRRVGHTLELTTGTPSQPLLPGRGPVHDLEQETSAAGAPTAARDPCKSGQSRHLIGLEAAFPSPS